MDNSSLQLTGADISAVSGDKAAAAANATLAAAAGKTNYLAGFDIVGGGATAASVILVTVTGLKAGTLTYPVAIPAGVSAQVNFQVRFPYPLEASGQNQAIVVNVPSFGAGNTHADTTAYGFQLG